jgi:flagellar protein FlaG
MSELSTQMTDARAVLTDASRKDAAAEAARSATAGQGGGKELPPVSDSQGAVQAQERAASQEQRVERAVAKLNDYVQSIQRDLRFSVDQELGRPIVSVIDRSSQEVIRQIPNDVTIRLARNLNAQEAARLAEAYDQAGTQGGGASGRLGLINTRI